MWPDRAFLGFIPTSPHLQSLSLVRLNPPPPSTIGMFSFMYTVPWQLQSGFPFSHSSAGSHWGHACEQALPPPSELACGLIGALSDLVSPGLIPGSNFAFGYEMLWNFWMQRKCYPRPSSWKSRWLAQWKNLQWEFFLYAGCMWLFHQMKLSALNWTSGVGINLLVPPPWFPSVSWVVPPLNLWKFQLNNQVSVHKNFPLRECASGDFCMWLIAVVLYYPIKRYKTLDLASLLVALLFTQSTCAKTTQRRPHSGSVQSIDKKLNEKQWDLL